MKTIVYRDGIATVTERDVPQPGENEVLVRIAVSGVNPVDLQLRDRGTTGTPHLDGSGVIEAVGPGVDESRVGRRVWLYLTGTAAQYAVVPAARAVPLPEHAGFVAGASLGVPALTAHRALTVAEDGPARLRPGALDGKVVLAAGGAGAVGHAVIQLARWAGATVIATVSGPGKAALATAAGAHRVVGYREIAEIGPGTVDVVAEVALGANLDLDLAVLKPRGTIAAYGNLGDRPVEVSMGRLLVLNARLQFLVLSTAGPEVISAAVEDVSAALEDGALPVGEEHGLPLVRFPLAGTADAHRAVAGGATGKVLIDVQE